MCVYRHRTWSLMDAPKKVYAPPCCCVTPLSRAGRLVCGHVPAAQTDELFTRLASVNAKAGPFGFAFVCGGLVEPHSTGNWEAEPHLLPYIRGERAVAVPTYFCHPTLDPCMVCDNLFCLGSFGVMRLEGLNVGFLWDDAAAQMTVDCVEAADRARGIDVLITRRWPQGILNQVAAADLPPRQTYETSDAAAAVAVALGPRYIFSPGERYFERRPYVTAQHPKHATRFFALAPVGNATKDKWIYAFRLAPNECAPLPEAVMSSPFGAAPPPRRARDDEQQGFKRWADLPADAGQQGERERRKKRPNADIYEKRSGGCWFCLESPTADHHLLVSLGDLTYLALAKGGVSEDHVIVLPQEHSTAVVDLPEATTLELERYKASLTAYAASVGNKKYMFYERNVPTKFAKD